jgi:hypothetical protein
VSIGNNYRLFDVSYLPLIFRGRVQFDPENKVIISLRNVGDCLPSDKAQHPGRLESSDCVSITRTNPLMLQRENTVFCSKNSGEHVSTLCGQNTKTFIIKRSGMYVQKQLNVLLTVHRNISVV